LIIINNLSSSSNTNTLGNLYTTGGNVGINTTSPIQRLHVEGNIYSSGDVISFSDLRLKTNIEPLTNCLSKIQLLRGVSFNKLNVNSNKKYIGFIAQELEQIFPELVYTDPISNYKSVAYSNSVAILLECIKEQQLQIESLSNDVDLLKQKI
jgi:hypothetical protein